ncbi:MAG: RNA polymerase sigma-70 factor [Bacteroidales bacterium]|nr:RNA polymerase sigma-70 factor [Bacteroidales bacterium]
MSREGISLSQFEQVFREQYSRLYYYANDFVQDDEAARDIVSDVFTAVWNARERMMFSTLPSYLMTSIRNQSINYLRKNAGRESFEPNDAMAALMADNEEDLSMLNERLDKLQGLVSQLPDKTRHVLEECYYHDKKYSEVACEMGITSDGVKKHIVKAFRLLRESFGISQNR